MLHFWPGAREYFAGLAKMPYDRQAPDAALDAWAAGRTGYPIVDAGMRQLLADGWMHNRVRMIVASFLVKDLHVGWTHGARHFMRHLVDGDLASNQHGWQWTAGTGTDAAPYFRVFNPVTQGNKFDPDGDYVRRWVPELAGLPGREIHEPWLRRAACRTATRSGSSTTRKSATSRSRPTVLARPLLSAGQAEPDPDTQVPGPGIPGMESCGYSGRKNPWKTNCVTRTASPCAPRPLLESKGAAP